MCTFKFEKHIQVQSSGSQPWLPGALPSKIVIYLIWGCGLGFGLFFFKAPQVILIEARIENHCFGQWGAMESLK